MKIIYTVYLCDNFPFIALLGAEVSRIDVPDTPSRKYARFKPATSIRE